MDICLAIHNLDLKFSSSKFGQKTKKTQEIQTHYTNKTTHLNMFKASQLETHSPTLLNCLLSRAGQRGPSVYNGNAIIAPAIRNG